MAANSKNNAQTVSIIAVTMLGIVALILAVALFVKPASFTIQPTNAPNGTIVVYATGVANGKPTQGQIYLYINGSATTTTNAVANLSASLELLNKSIEPYLNYNSSEISTQSYTVYKPYSYCPGPIIEGTGNVTGYPIQYNCSASKNYVAQESIYVTVPNIDNLSIFLGAASSIPNVYVQSVSALFSEKQTQALTKAAYADAIANATAQAQALAVNKSIYLINVTTSGYGYRPVYLYNAASAGSSVNPAPSIPVYFSNQQVTESVQATFGYNSR